MSKVVVADSSCLIGYAKIGRLDILRRLFKTIVIPRAVFHEVVIKGAGRPGAEDVKKASWIKTAQAENELAVRSFRLTLGAGESEAITLASEREADFLILDDWNARQMALGLDLPVIGTVAILKKAAEKGWIDNFEDELERLRQSGFRYF